MNEEHEHHARIAEFNALRAEILYRLGARDRAFALSLTATGLLFGLGFQNEPLLLSLIPILQCPFVVLWAYQDTAVVRLGWYICSGIETKNSGLGWESHIFKERDKRSDEVLSPQVIYFIRGWNLTRYSEVVAVLMFIGLSIIALALFAFNYSESLAVRTTLIFIDAVLIWFSGSQIRNRSKVQAKYLQRSE